MVVFVEAVKSMLDIAATQPPKKMINITFFWGLAARHYNV
jgi:hypothetical protein